VVRAQQLVLLALGAGACTSPSPPPPVTEASAAPVRLPLASAAPPAPAVPEAAAVASPPVLDVAAVLFPDAATTPPSAARCAAGPDRLRCLFSARYEADPAALRLALDLHDATGSVAGVQVEQDMDGGFRGKLHLVPELPIGKHRRHLAWVAAAGADFDAFFAALAPLARAPVRYRVRPLAFRFFRSVGRTTPSAYADGWAVSYNVSGSLHGSAEAVRDTLFHEVFHLNDADHGDWSPRALGADYGEIVRRCGTRVACLAPYAPGDTMVRGGTYYAFQPDNGEPVHEYAAELALRYFREQRAALRGERPGNVAFKCGPDENRRAWAAMAAEFFGGADAVPDCGR